MTLTLLLDLDDTLLHTNLDTFMPAYFRALADHVCGHVPSDSFLRALIGGTSRMAENEDPRLSLKEVFDSYFYPKLGIPQEELREVLEDFYDNVFPGLQAYTSQVQGAVEFVTWAISSGFQVAVATDPLFPMKATRHRLRWAGFDPDQFQLVSAYEDFHFSKATPAYYAEVLGRMGWHEGPMLMVGNDPSRDILSAHRMGLKTFLIEGESISTPGVEAGRGRLSDVRPWLESTEFSSLEPSVHTREAILGMLASTPAVISHFIESMSEVELKREPAHDDWAMNEIACHLRDTEREVHALQLELLMEKNDAFIPRPDTAVWASERDYLVEDASLAAAEFANSRVEFLRKVNSMPAEMWRRSARHAIFGPTDLKEILGFMADHDRMHLQQAWRIMRSLTGERV